MNMQAKFKKGDRVVAVRRDGRIEGGMKGVVDQDNDTIPWVVWENGRIDCTAESNLKLDEQHTTSTRIASEMTIRERFAMAAMQGLLSGANQEEDIYCNAFAQNALSLADALINALNEKP